MKKVSVMIWRKVSECDSYRQELSNIYFARSLLKEDVFSLTFLLSYFIL